MKKTNIKMMKDTDTLSTSVQDDQNINSESVTKYLSLQWILEVLASVTKYVLYISGAAAAAAGLMRFKNGCADCEKEEEEAVEGGGREEEETLLL